MAITSQPLALAICSAIIDTPPLPSTNTFWPGLSARGPSCSAFHAVTPAQGIPFVGQAGKLLDTLLESIGLVRADVYITNVVKFRPPENRDPTPEEKEACLPFLQMELAIIRPKVLVPLGRHALTTFFTKMSISDAHGKAHALPDGSAVFPIYHPAAALHNPGLRQALFDDFSALKKFLDERK